VKEALLGRDTDYIRFFLRHRLWAKAWSEYSLSNLDYAMSVGGIFHLWGHAFEIDDQNEWGNLEKIFAEIHTLERKGRVVVRVNTASLKVENGSQ
jgi:hypothetical protein